MGSSAGFNYGDAGRKNHDPQSPPNAFSGFELPEMPEVTVAQA
jgi:hypothetical protein